MSTQFVARLSLALFAIAVSFGAFTWAQSPISARPVGDVKPISVASFTEALPVGYLGAQLGTIVRVTGVAFDGNLTRAKADEGKILLRIVTVNDKDLPKPIIFHFHRAPDSVKKPNVGERFDYYVHEYGAFDGVVTPPKELGIEERHVANDGFHYRHYLTVHASNDVHN